MDIDAKAAAALGWPKLKYAYVERERRWLCGAVPWDRVVSSETLTDLYVTGTRLRLREAVPLGGGKPALRLGRKADVDAFTRLITSLYLSPKEFDLLRGLPGKVLRKIRHQVGEVQGVSMSVDVFLGPLQGLIMAEAEFDSDEAMAAFQAPPFVVREVTADSRYNGGELVERGLPTPS